MRERFGKEGRRGFAWLGALLLALLLLSIAAATAVGRHERERATLDKALSNEARKQSEALDHYFARARSLTRSLRPTRPSASSMRSRATRRRRQGPPQGHAVREANAALAYLEHLFPGSIGEACFIDRAGPENARAVSGEVAPLADLSPDETKAPFFVPPSRSSRARSTRPSPTSRRTRTLGRLQLDAAAIQGPGGTRDRALRDLGRKLPAEASDASGRFDVAIVEAGSGRVIVDSRYPQPTGDEARLGRPFDRRFGQVVSTAGRAFHEGTMELGGKPSAFRAVAHSPHNANQWVVIAMAKTPSSSWTDQLGAAELAMGALGLVLLGYALLALRSSHARLHTAATTDALTGLGNRRRLVAGLEAALTTADAPASFVLVILDLDGFKGYNDTFGHPAGDELLKRLSANLQSSFEGLGTPYRMGGDEFCVLAPISGGQSRDEIAARAERALSEHGEGFTITCSHGSIVIPAEATQIDEVLRIADQRMYADKNGGRASARAPVDSTSWSACSPSATPTSASTSTR